MSWSIYKSGTVEEVVNALEENYRDTPAGDQSKEEYDAAKPHLIALVKENVGVNINLSAYGHGVKNAEGSFDSKSCQVDIKTTM